MNTIRKLVIPLFYLLTIGWLFVATAAEAQDRIPLTPSMDINKSIISVVWYDSHTELDKAFEKYVGEYRKFARGFSIIWFSEAGVPYCEMHVIRPIYLNGLDDIEYMVLGHEVLHCFLGTYHQ